MVPDPWNSPFNRRNNTQHVKLVTATSKVQRSPDGEAEGCEGAGKAAQRVWQRVEMPEAKQGKGTACLGHSRGQHPVAGGTMRGRSQPNHVGLHLGHPVGKGTEGLGTSQVDMHMALEGRS